MNKSITLSETRNMYGDEIVRGYGARPTMIPAGYTTPIKLADNFDGGQLSNIRASATFTGAEESSTPFGKTTTLCWNIEITAPISYRFSYSTGSGYARLLWTRELKDFNKWAAKRSSRSLLSLLRIYNQNISTASTKIKLVPDTPALESVIHCIMVDASCYDQCEDIDEFAVEMGYSLEDGISNIQAAYEACALAHKKLGHIVKSIGLTDEELGELFQDY